MNLQFCEFSEFDEFREIIEFDDFSAFREFDDFVNLAIKSLIGVTYFLHIRVG